MFTDDTPKVLDMPCRFIPAYKPLYVLNIIARGTSQAFHDGFAGCFWHYSPLNLYFSIAVRRAG